MEEADLVLRRAVADGGEWTRKEGNFNVFFASRSTFEPEPDLKTKRRIDCEEFQ